jgi:hypothetical protein
MILRNVFILLSIIFLLGCSRAQRANIMAVGSKHRITLYSGNIAVRTWVTTGSVENEEKSDGYYFQDDATKKLVRVSGAVVIEQE